MILIIIGILVGVGVGLLIGGEDAFGIVGTFFASAIMALLGGVVALLVAMILGIFIYGDDSFHYVQRSDTPLVSLADGSETEGHFFLGSGYVDGNPTYTWYEADGENNFVRRDADADETVIHYLKPGEKPHYTFSEGEPDGGWLGPVGTNMSGDGIEQYDFYVPPGSIERSYKLDNK